MKIKIKKISELIGNTFNQVSVPPRKIGFMISTFDTIDNSLIKLVTKLLDKENSSLDTLFLIPVNLEEESEESEDKKPSIGLKYWGVLDYVKKNLADKKNILSKIRVATGNESSNIYDVFYSIARCYIIDDLAELHLIVNKEDEKLGSSILMKYPNFNKLISRKRLRIDKV